MLESWFPTLIYSENISNELDNSINLKIYERLKEFKKKYKNNNIWNCDTYTTLDINSINLFNEEYFSDVLKVCKQHVLNFAKEFMVDPKYKLYCKEFWGNISAPGDFQERHTHINSVFSLVYYVKCAENCGDIVFYNPRSEECLTLPNTLKNTNSNYTFCSYKAVESNILIFRSNVAHMVKQNKSNEDRCSLAMNFSYKELMEN